jgi:hypothetical protein
MKKALDYINWLIEALQDGIALNLNDDEILIHLTNIRDLLKEEMVHDDTI